MTLWGKEEIRDLTHFLLKHYNLLKFKKKKKKNEYENVLFYFTV